MHRKRSGWLEARLREWLRSQRQRVAQRRALAMIRIRPDARLLADAGIDETEDAGRAGHGGGHGGDRGQDRPRWLS